MNTSHTVVRLCPCSGLMAWVSVFAIALGGELPRAAAEEPLRASKLRVVSAETPSTLAEKGTTRLKAKPAAAASGFVVQEPSEKNEGPTDDEVTALGADIRPIGALTTNIAVPGKDVPPDFAHLRFAREGEEFYPSGIGRPWLHYNYYWQASGFCHQPLYFEEVNLERYGYTCACPCLQPVCSAAHFFATVPLLPYKMVTQPPCDCQYTLGYYRPGSWAPYQCQRPIISADATAVEAALIVGLIFLIP